MAVGAFGQSPPAGEARTHWPAGSQPDSRTATPTLSLDEAIGIALESNPAYLQLENDVGVAKSSVRAAWGALLPGAQASTSLGYTAGGSQRLGTMVFDVEPAFLSSAYELGVGYRLSGATIVQPAVERARQRAATANVLGAAADLRAAVTHQYLELLRARDQSLQAEKELRRTAEHLRLARAVRDAGDGTDLDVRRAELQHSRAEVALVEARHAARTQILALSELLGRQLDPETRLTSTFSVFSPNFRADSLVALAIAAQPALAAARAQVQATRVSAVAARAAYLPSLTLQLGVRGFATQFADVDPLVGRMLDPSRYDECLRQNRLLSLIDEGPQACLDPDDPAVRRKLRDELEARNGGFPFDYARIPLQASVTVSVPIFNGFARRLEVDRADAARADAGHEVRAAELRIRRGVETALLDLEAAFEAARLQEEVRSSGEIEVKLASERFRVGLTDALEVTDAETNLAAAERDLIAARYAFHQALARLEALVGGPIR